MQIDVVVPVVVSICSEMAPVWRNRQPPMVALQASSGSCAVREEESGEEVRVVQGIGVPFYRAGERMGRQGGGGAPVVATIKAQWS
jgi:hypothetical protein